MYKTFITLVTGLLVMSCAGQRAAQDRLVALIGQPVAKAVETYGSDYVTRPGYDGGLLYRWRFVETALSPGHWEPPNPSVSVSGDRVSTAVSSGRFLPGKPVTVFCQLELQVSADGLIRDWRMQGAGCPYALQGETVRSRDAVAPTGTPD